MTKVASAFSGGVCGIAQCCKAMLLWYKDKVESAEHHISSTSQTHNSSAALLHITTLLESCASLGMNCVDSQSSPRRCPHTKAVRTRGCTHFEPWSSVRKQHCEHCDRRDSRQLTALCVRWWDVMWDAAPGAYFSRDELQMPPALTRGEKNQAFVSMQRCLSTCPGIELEPRWSVCCRTTGIRRRSRCISYQQKV